MRSLGYPASCRTNDIPTQFVGGYEVCVAADGFGAGKLAQHERRCES